MTDESDRPDRPPLILIAEDEPLASMALRALIEAVGGEILGPARSGEEALALGACFPIDLAILDMRMPGPSGLEVAQELFDLGQTPALLLTGVGRGELPETLPDPPIVRLLTKPVELSELQRSVEEARTRTKFWSEAGHTDPALVQTSRRDRQTVARAVRATAEGGRLAPAARELLRTAREQDRAPAEIARDILRKIGS